MKTLLAAFAMVLFLATPASAQGVNCDQPDGIASVVFCTQNEMIALGTFPRATAYYLATSGVVLDKLRDGDVSERDAQIALTLISQRTIAIAEGEMAAAGY